MPECRICGTDGGHPRHSAREMMFGSREAFEYFQCGDCGCLQISEIPSNLSGHYRDDYYSLAELPRLGTLRLLLKRLWASHILVKPNPIGSLLQRRYGVPAVFDWVRRAGIGFDQPILDVGCGKGHILQALDHAGFSNLQGVDPFVEREIRIGRTGRVLRQSLEETEGIYDFILLNHSLEHMDDPGTALQHVHRLLREGSVALVRIPVAERYAWRTYGADWVQLDAPRHLHLLTERSFRLLAERANLRIEQISYDSTAFQFWGSEQYRNNIPLRDERSFAVAPEKSVFTGAQIEEYEQRAARLNEERDGDQACFWLRKAVIGPTNRSS